MLTEKQKYALKMMTKGYVIVQDLSGPPHRTYLMLRNGLSTSNIMSQTLVGLLRSGFVGMSRRQWVKNGRVYEINRDGIDALSSENIEEAMTGTRRDVAMNIPRSVSNEAKKRKIVSMLNDLKTQIAAIHEQISILGGML